MTLADQCRTWARFPDVLVPHLHEDAALTMRERLLLDAVLSTVADLLDVVPAGATLSDMERVAIVRALEVCGGSQAKAAEALGTSPRLLNSKMKKWGLRPKDIYVSAAGRQ